MDDGQEVDREIEDHKRILTVGSKHEGPTTVRSSGATRRIIPGVS
jgi:hypothetical protein